MEKRRKAVFPLPPLLTSVLESLLLSLALSTDAFVASFSYGTGRIRLPLSSALVISAVCSALLAAALFLGGLVRPLLPRETVKVLCFLMLFLLAVLLVSGFQ